MGSVISEAPTHAAVGDSEHTPDAHSFEAAVMAGDAAANEWLQACARMDSQLTDEAAVDDDEAPPGDGAAPWLPMLGAEDRALVREYMLASRYPEAATHSLDEWPLSELRHLLDAARRWRVRESQRITERAELDHQLHELETRHAENRVVLDRSYREQATALLARDQDKSIMVITARECRRSRTGNYSQGNAGIDLERHIRDAAAERGFAIGQPHWDRASKRLLIDLYHLEAEAWWDSGEASGLVHVAPNGKALQSTRRYRALYPFQRAAINAAYVNRYMQMDATPRSEATESQGPLGGGAADAHTSTGTGPERMDVDHVEQGREMTTVPQPDTLTGQTARAGSNASLSATSPNGTTEQPATSHPPAPSSSRPASVPNARKGFRLTLWVSPTDESGLADAHGFVQLDGADPVPFCQLKAVPNPLARALQEAYVAIERVRARPPRMAPPTAPDVRSTSTPRARPVEPGLPPQQPPRAVQAVAKTRVAQAQPSLF